jgi:starch synthase
MKLLFVSPELAPLIQQGGLGEGLSGLAKTFVRRGHQVTVALPRFAKGEPEGLTLQEHTPITLRDSPSDTLIDVKIYETRLDPGIRVMLFDVPGFHDKLGIWGTETEDNTDNARRFAIFSRAVVEHICLRHRDGDAYEIVHAHDWPVAMVPYLLREHRGEMPALRTVTTIHNLIFQGIFPANAIDHFELDARHLSPDRLGFYDRMNFQKGGIVSADAVTTVSPTYAKEITAAKNGELLDADLRARGRALVGIVNGIDTTLWNPKGDPFLDATYDADDASNKSRCKKSLLDEIGIAITDRPLVVSLGRVAIQKGSDVLAQALGEIAASGADVVIAGTGETERIDALREATSRVPDHAKYLGFVDDRMAHRLVAAADILAMPSRFEPCGVVQLFAQRYGALPVVHRTGGLADTVIDGSIAVASGIAFDGLTPQNISRAIARAIEIVKSEAWPTMRARIMRINVSWTRAAAHYEQLYRAIQTTRLG